MQKTNALFVAFFFISALAIAQKPIFTTAKTTAVTVYFSSAEISQTTSALLPKGTSEIVVKNVADYLNENTLQIGASANVTVLSAQFTTNYVSEYDAGEKSAISKNVRDSIALVEKTIKKATNAMDAEAKVIELLDKNQQVYGANSGLSVAELTKMVEYYKMKRAESGNLYDALEDKIKRLNELLSGLKNRLDVNLKNEEKTSKGKLVLQIMNDVAGNVAFEISYLSNAASWEPFYDLRANSVSEPIDMTYKARVVQSTGIDWKKVKLSLSSGNPNQNNQAPQLNPWFLRYQNDYKEVELRDGDKKMEEVVVTNQGIRKDKKSLGYLNAVVGAEISENQLNVSFDIPLPYDILSNGKAHSVALDQIKLPATYKYFAAPKAEKDAFLLAEVNDYGKYNLLPGEANVIFENMHVGKTFIDPNQTADTLRLSMGRDRKIAITREKVIDKSGTKFLSAKKEQTFTYDITVRNNKKEAVAILLQDQYPISTDKETEVEFKESDNAKQNPETGLLSWNLNLKPGESKKLRISYKIRSPKDKVIENL